MIDLEEFNRRKREALLSLDEGKIRAFAKEMGMDDFPDNPEVFWGSVHKAITGTPSLPIEFRRQSKKYLDDRGFRSLDDGDL